MTTCESRPHTEMVKDRRQTGYKHTEQCCTYKMMFNRYFRHALNWIAGTGSSSYCKLVASVQFT